MPSQPLRVLLQTTIPPIADDWNIGRFRFLKDHLARLEDIEGRPVCKVTARDRSTSPGIDDPVLAEIDHSDIDQVWLFAVDGGDGLTPAECRALDAFRRRGGGLLVTRDHMDLGSSVTALSDIGAAHYFHSRNLDPDPGRRCIDDPFTTQIQWPNYHSGANGDYQAIEPVDVGHPLLRSRTAPGGIIRYFPAHPHEGGIGLPAGSKDARIVARGRSKATGVAFNLVIAFDPAAAPTGARTGRAIAQSTFHHFCDYNWDVRAGCPSFVDEPPGDGMVHHPEVRRDMETYVRNVALWLARQD
jgi:hypothetical protein